MYLEKVFVFKKIDEYRIATIRRLFFLK